MSEVLIHVQPHHLCHANKLAGYAFEAATAKDPIHYIISFILNFVGSDPVFVMLTESNLVSRYLPTLLRTMVQKERSKIIGDAGDRTPGLPQANILNRVQSGCSTTEPHPR